MVAAHVGHLGEHVGDLVGRAVVQEALPDLRVATAGEQYGALGVAVEGGVGHQLDGGPAESAVGALDDVEREPGQPEPAPFLLERVGLLGVDVEVHGPQVVGREGAGVLQGTGGGQVEPVDQDDHDVAAQDGRLGRLDRARLEQDVLQVVLAVQADQADVEQRARPPRRSRRPR